MMLADALGGGLCPDSCHNSMVGASVLCVANIMGDFCTVCCSQGFFVFVFFFRGMGEMIIACEIGDFLNFFHSEVPSSYHTHSWLPSPVVLNWHLGSNATMEW